MKPQISRYSSLIIMTWLEYDFYIIRRTTFISWNANLPDSCPMYTDINHYQTFLFTGYGMFCSIVLFVREKASVCLLMLSAKLDIHRYLFCGMAWLRIEPATAHS